MSGQSLNDRLMAARHTLAGQGLARVVCKATTEEVIGPKKKHLDYLLHCTNEPNVSIPQMANLLIERTQNPNWVVVFKSLVTVHHLMCYGNERFTQYLASSNCTFNLSSFSDCKTATLQSAADMSTFIRRYAKYLNEKALSYRTVAFDFCKVKRGKEDGTLRLMATEKLLKTVPALQGQLDALLEFDCTAQDLTNGVINAAFMLLFRDLIRLFACYNDAIINLLEKYFEMNKKQARDTLDIYKKFLIRMDRVAEFLKVAENVGIDKGDIPDLTKAPSSLLDALEQHLATLEGRKHVPSTSIASGSSSSASHATNLANAVSALCSTSDSFSNSATFRAYSGGATGATSGGDDETLRRALEEEAHMMQQLKSISFMGEPFVTDAAKNGGFSTSERHLQERGGDSATNNPFLSGSSDMGAAVGMTSASQANPNAAILDLFGAPSPAQPVNAVPPSMNASSGIGDDLLCLGNNPFASMGAPPPPVAATNVFAPTNNGVTNGGGGLSGGFASDASFAAAFGDNIPAGVGSGGFQPQAPVVTADNPFASAAVITSITPPPFTTSAASPQPTAEALRPVSVSPEPRSESGVMAAPTSDDHSVTPSPTADQMMRGAGTTPILTHPTEPMAGTSPDTTDPFAAASGAGAGAIEAPPVVAAPPFANPPTATAAPPVPPPPTAAAVAGVFQPAVVAAPQAAPAPVPPPTLDDLFGVFDAPGDVGQAPLAPQAFSAAPYVAPVMSTAAAVAPSSAAHFDMVEEFTKPMPAPTTMPFPMAMVGQPTAGKEPFGNVLQPKPMAGGGAQPMSKAAGSGGVLKGASDLDSALMSLVENLDVNRPSAPKGAQQWGQRPAVPTTGPMQAAPGQPRMPQNDPFGL